MHNTKVHLIPGLTYEKTVNVKLYNTSNLLYNNLM